ncbi:MAG: minichromosome maintenance protein MCM [Candidatus Thermoplasmatota archaeon]|nr:minichromosome maintenance protein MCM [Candidatus Thermoplasmatota archaeon]
MTRYTDEELLSKWEEFFDQHGYESKITAIADIFPQKKSLDVRFEDLDRYDSDFAIHSLSNPARAVSAGEEAIAGVVPPTDEDMSIHLRVRGLPRDRRIMIRDLRSKHVGRFIAIEGLVRKATEVRPMIVGAMFECMRCGHKFMTKQEGMAFREPLECPQSSGGCGKSSSSTRFNLILDESKFIDTQKIEMQEKPEILRGGAQPERLTAYCVDDLAGIITPGDRVVLNGELKSVQRTRMRAKSTVFDIFIDANSVESEQLQFKDIEVTEEDIARIKEVASDERIVENIISSISPVIFGLTTEKEALVLQLFGGVAKEMPDGTRIRGDIHILLVGDPGTGKSQLLTYMSQLSPRSVYTAGKASSAAGLTAAAVRDEFGEGRWTLEAGAMVLGDGGLVCIDEIEKMNPQDRDAIHLGMEQQFISISKAGITATLPTRCAILAAANPRFGRFDEHKFISEQIELSPTLLSRFDVIFSILDIPESRRDMDMADHMLKGHLVGELRKRKEEGIRTDIPDTEVFEPYFEPEFLRKYVAYAKQINPVLTPEAIEIIKEKYLEIRKQGEAEGSAVPITPRQLEAFVRLAEASARAQLSETVTEDDARRSVRIVEYWLRKVAGEAGRFDIDIIVTGTSTSQREHMMALRDIIRELSDEEDSADISDIISMAEEKGMHSSRVESLLKRWSQEGEVYSPSKNRYKLVGGR